MNHAPVHDVSHQAALAAGHEGGQQHPLPVYFKVWGLLFVLSAMSYAVDYFQVEGVLRWTLMHMAWERLALIYAILIPPIALGTLIWLMLIESDYTFWTRILFFDAGA